MIIPKVQVVIPEVIPSTQMLIVKPLMDLHKRGLLILRVDSETTMKLEYLSWADMVVFSRNVHPSNFPLLQHIVSKNIPYIYDLDDNFLDIPPIFSSGRLLQQPQYQYMLNVFLSRASLVRVHSNVLLEQISPLSNNPQIVVYGPIDWSLIHPPTHKRPKQPLKIVYATSRSQEDFLGNIFSGAIEKIFRKYPKNVQVHFLGYNPLVNTRYQNLHFEPFRTNYDAYSRRFSSAGYDIGLAPLLNDRFHRSKSNVKYREYAACQIAGIYSNVDVYSKWVNHGHTGLLVENSEEAWFNAIENLLLDQKLREKIQSAAYNHARTTFSQDKFADEWWTHIQQVFALSQLTVPEKNFILPDQIPSKKENKYVQKKPLLFRIKKVLRSEGALGILYRIRNRLEISLYIKRVKHIIKHK